MAVAITAEELDFGPGPKAGITITGLLVGTSVLTLWRTSDNIRKEVRGHRKVTAVEGTFIEDWDVPTNRPVTYEVEVLSGPGGPARATAAPLTIVDDSSWIMDPFIPQSALRIHGERREGNLFFRSPALEALELNGQVNMFDIMNGETVALFGQRMREKNIDLSMATRSAVESANLKDLLLSSTGFLFRPGPELAGLELPGVMFISVAKVTQRPTDSLWGGEATWWDLTADTVAAPKLRVLTATFTYADVQAMYDTYGANQDAFFGLTYLDNLKHPTG